jgi:hypothetical protein
MIHAQIGAKFNISSLGGWDDTYTLSVDTERTSLSIFLNKKQLSDLAFLADTYLRSLDERADCEMCQGMGVLAVANGSDSWSGDDPCPNCQQ